MKEKNKENKTRWLHLRLTETEYNQLRAAFLATTEKKLSCYARNILLGKPMTASIRNASADALIPLLSQLLKDVNGIGNNFNQAVHVLHTLRNHEQVLRWLIRFEPDRKQLLDSITAIKDFIHQHGEKWLQ